MKFLKNKKAFALIFGTTAAIVTLILAYTNVLAAWQLRLGDLLYSQRSPSSDITVVTIDDKSLSDSTGLGSYENWQRDNFAKVLNNIDKYNPKVVAFDFFFKSAKDQQKDEQFKEALQNTKNPVIIYWGSSTSYDQRGYYIQDPNIFPFELPLDLFNQLENIKISMAKVIPDADNAIRKILPILVNPDGTYYESFALTIARIALNAQNKPSTPLVSPTQYQIKLQNGNTVNIPLQEGQMYVNYATQPGTESYASIPFVDVYNENYSSTDPEKLFKDKIVLIGPTSSYFKDFQLTPMSKKDQMTGIEIHANALQTILEQKFLRNFSFPEQALLILILAFTAAFTFMFTKIRWSLLYLFGVPVAYSFTAKPLFNIGIIPDLVHPYLVVAVTFIAVYLYRYVTEFREKLELQKAFGKYVNPALVKQISEHPESLKLGGESRNITVMFTDIAHSTTIEEKLKPQSVVALLSEYFEAMSRVIMEEGGTVDKFEGDGIMALFGAPVSQQDHAVRAARAALKMRLKLNELLEKWKKDPPLPGGEPKPEIDFRCGLSSGEAIVGNMGSTERFDYTALGDVVNLGARLESQNKEYETHIMMSQSTYGIIKDQFETRELDTILVVGKTEPIKVFELLAPKGELPADAVKLLQQYNEAMVLFHSRKFKEAHGKFTEILKAYPDDGPTKLYVERSEIYSNFPPPADWNGVTRKTSK